jgi:adenosyl cobinamide kinase/adenosyl cobinamide phosphate guanylyltransferase
MKQGQKSKRLSVRLGVEEWDFLQREAEESGMVLSDFVRAWVRDRMGVQNEKEYREKKPRKKYREENKEACWEVAAQVAKVGNNINQLARWANTYKSAAEGARMIVLFSAALAKLENIRAMFRED